MSSNERKRRSPRLPKSVEVRVAGRGEAGEVIVETTETLDISKHGAAVITRNRFPVGSPVALRRPGAKPMRARVVSAKPGKEEGTLHLGVEFVGEEGHWDLEFPKDWEDYFRRQSAADATTEGPSTENRSKLRQADSALETVLRKAEALRQQAESMLAEHAAQVDGARRQNTSVLAAQVEEFRTWKGLLEGETSAQVGAAKDNLAAEIERGRVRLEEETRSLERRVKELTGECEAGLKSAEELYHKVRVEEAQKNVKLVAKISAQLEAQRKTMHVLEDQAAAWRQRTNESLQGFQREVQTLLQKAAGEMQSSSAASISDFRGKIPTLNQELEKHFATFLGQQKAASTAWLEQAAKGVHEGTATLAVEHRASLEKHGQRSLEDFSNRLAGRLDDFRKSGDELAGPLDARADRVRGLLVEMAQETDRAVEKARADLASVVAKSGEQLDAMAAQKTAQLLEAEAASRKRLQTAGEGVLHSAHEATKRVDQSSIDLQALGGKLHQQASANRKELEAQFAGLLSMYDNRKEALDRLLETIESGRAALRDGIDILRVNAEEQQARLRRFTGEQEAGLKTHTGEMTQRLAASLTVMEAELRERATASLEASHQVYTERLTSGSADGQRKFSESLDQRMREAGERIPGMLQELDAALAQHSATLSNDASGHQAAMTLTRESVEQQGRASHEALREKHASAEESMRQALTAALSTMEDKQAASAATITALLSNIETHQAATTKQHGDVEKQVQKWRGDLATDFSKLSARMDEKRTVLESFYTFAEQSKSAWVKNMGAIDRRIEDARVAITGMEKTAGTNLEKQASAQGDQIETRLRQSLTTAQNELNAVAEAAESVFQARINDHSQQTLKAIERQVDQSANGTAISLERTMQNERKEHERLVAELGRRFDDTLREQLDGFRDQTMRAVSEMREQMQQVSRAMLDQVKESREELARELPGKLTAAEETFHRNLERIQERTLAAATEEMRSRASQWKARGEMELTAPKRD